MFIATLSTIDKIEDMETTQMPSNRWMDQAVVIYILYVDCVHIDMCTHVCVMEWNAVLRKRITQFV